MTPDRKVRRARGDYEAVRAKIARVRRDMRPDASSKRTRERQPDRKEIDVVPFIPDDAGLLVSL